MIKEFGWFALGWDDGFSCWGIDIVDWKLYIDIGSLYIVLGRRDND